MQIDPAMWISSPPGESAAPPGANGLIDGEFDLILAQNFIATPGEEVISTEPNAQETNLDFLPEISIDTDADAEVDAKVVSEKDSESDSETDAIRMSAQLAAFVPQWVPQIPVMPAQALATVMGLAPLSGLKISNSTFSQVPTEQSVGAAAFQPAPFANRVSDIPQPAVDTAPTPDATATVPLPSNEFNAETTPITIPMNAEKPMQPTEIRFGTPEEKPSDAPGVSVAGLNPMDLAGEQQLDETITTNLRLIEVSSQVADQVDLGAKIPTIQAPVYGGNRPPVVAKVPLESETSTTKPATAAVVTPVNAPVATEPIAKAEVPQTSANVVPGQPTDVTSDEVTVAPENQPTESSALQPAEAKAEVQKPKAETVLKSNEEPVQSLIQESTPELKKRSKASTAIDGLKATETKPEEVTPRPEVQPVAGPTRTERAAPVQMQRPEVDSKEIVQQVMERIQRLQELRPPTNITLKLNPLDLGSITIQVRTVDGKNEAQIQCSNPQVHQALQSNKQDLMQTAEAKGLNLSSLDLTQQQQHDPNGRHANQQDFQRTVNMRAADASVEPTMQPTEVVQLRPGVDTLDVRI